MPERTIYQCGICNIRRYFYYRRIVVVLRRKECEKCRYRKTCPYFKVKTRKGVCPTCTRKAKHCGMIKI